MTRSHALCLFTVLSAALPACSGDPETSAAPDPLAQQLETARKVGEKYAGQPVSVAEADGFHAEGPCVEDAALGGGMGYHYVHAERIANPPKLEEPAGLVYVPDGSGGKTLAALEYFQFIFVDGAPYVADASSPPPASAIPATPEIFAGKPFDGPMPGHDPNMPWHFDQHVWLFLENPSGDFAAFHPNVKCPTQ